MEKVIQLDSYYYMAMVHLWYEWDFNSAEKKWLKFFQLNPSGFAWANPYTEFLHASGRFQEALDFSLKKYNHNKKDVINWAILAMSYYYINQPGKAQIILDSAWLRFKHPELPLVQARLLNYIGKYDQVIDNLNKYFEKFPDDRKAPLIQALLAISYFHTGRPAETKKILDSLQFRSKKSPVGSPSFSIAAIYTAIGKNDEAIKWLEKAYIDHEMEMYWLKVEPLFRPLHNDPRFQAILNKIGFK